MTVWKSRHHSVLWKTINVVPYLSYRILTSVYVPENWVTIALVYVMVCRLFGTRPLSEPIPDTRLKNIEDEISIKLK